jgi:transposase
MTPPTPSLSVEGLLALIGELKARNRMLEQQNAVLTARVAELERRLGLDSSNSSKPPSSDGPGKPPRRTQSLRERGQKKPGGQPGHAGKHLKRSERIDHRIAHRPARCGRCQAGLQDQPVQLVDSRQVFDLPAPAGLIVTEHQRYGCKCRGCGAVTTGSFPPAVSAPVQYGGRLAAVVSYLSAGQFLPEDRLGQVLADLFGVRVSAGTIGQMIARAAGRAQDFAAAVCEKIRQAPVKHLDETGFGRVASRNGCMWRAPPGATGWCITVCHPGAATCWRRRRISSCMTIGHPTFRCPALRMRCAMPITCAN